MNDHRRQAGFTMLEVLISMVIIAFGLLGVAGLQAFAIKNNQSATFRSTAALLANDMSDRIRANAGGAIDGNYNRPLVDAYTTPVPTCGGAGCTTSQLAQNDLFEWQERIRTTLPAGVGIVCLDDTPHDGVDSANPACDAAGGANTTNYVVKIWWQDERGTKTGLAAPLLRLSTPFNL